uniref:PDZ domain containing protein n=1 Tax=Haemonchus contortus TaxID=6289 RepID=A0A7I4Y1E3_HAECO
MSGTKEDGKKSKSSSSEEKEPQKMKKRRRKKKKGDTSPDEDELVALSKNTAALKASDEKIKVVIPEAAKHPETVQEGGANDGEVVRMNLTSFLRAKNTKESSSHGSGEKVTGKPTDHEKPIGKQSDEVQSPDKMGDPPALDESAFETLEKPEILDEKEESNSEEEIKRMLMEQEQKAQLKKDLQSSEGVPESHAVPKPGQSHEIQSTRKPETLVKPVKKPKIESPQKLAPGKIKKSPIDVIRKIKSADSGQKKEKMRKFSSVSEKMKKDISPRSSSRSRSEKTISDKESPSTMSVINRSDMLQTVDVPPRMPRRKSSSSLIKKEEVSPLITKDFTKSFYALPELEYHLRRSLSSPPSRESLASPTERTAIKERKSSPTKKRSPTAVPYHSVLEVATARERAHRPLRSPPVVEMSTARERHWTKSRSPSNEVSRGKEQLLTPTRSPSVTEMSTAKERRRTTERRSSSLKELWSAKKYSHRRIASSPGTEASTARECTRIATRSHSVTEMVTARERSSRRVRRSPSATELSTAREHSHRKVSSPPMAADESTAIDSREVSPALSPSFSSLKERPSLIDVELPEAKGFIEHPSVTPSETCVRKSASMIAVSPGVYRSEEPPIHHYKFVHVRMDLEGKPLDANLTENLVLIFIPINSPAFYHLVIGDQIVEINGLVPRNLTEFQERVEAATGQWQITFGVVRPWNVRPPTPERMAHVWTVKKYCYLIVELPFLRNMPDGFEFQCVSHGRLHINQVMPQSMGAFAFLIVDRIIDIDSVKIPHKVNMVALKNRIRAVQERDGFCSFLVERPSSLHHLTNPSCVAMKSTEPTMDVVMADDAVEIGCREAFKHIQVKDRKHRHHSIYGSTIHGHSPQDGGQLITAEDNDDVHSPFKHKGSRRKRRKLKIGKNPKEKPIPSDVKQGTPLSKASEGPLRKLVTKFISKTLHAGGR